MEDGTAGKINPDLQPNQHIYRRLTGLKMTAENQDTGSKIEVNPDPAWNPHYPPTAGNGNFPYWSHYDLLSLFLSLVGAAQPNADRLHCST